ncbi:DUF1707 SHOCT-like domain-containing protein [Actinokineospora sp. NPDC004072]
MGRDADIRVGTADRERAVAALSEHLSAGRIDIAEYEHRCAAATAARTRGDLAAIFDDLPAPHPRFQLAAPAPASAPAPAPLKRRRNNWVIGGFVVGGIALIVTVTAVTGSWWALAPALVVAAVLVLVAS